MNSIDKKLVDKLPKYIRTKNITFAEFQSGKGNCGIQFYSVVIEINEKEVCFHTETFAELLEILKDWKDEGFPLEFDGTI